MPWFQNENDTSTYQNENEWYEWQDASAYQTERDRVFDHRVLKHACVGNKNQLKNSGWKVNIAFVKFENTEIFTNIG
jgi:hypothetical protein